jgi:hypothetical protein
MTMSNKSWMIWFFLLGVFGFAAIAIGESQSVVSTGLDFGTKYLIVSGVLRLVSEGLGWIAEKTNATWDNKVANWLSVARNIVGKAGGLFGFGKPRLVK